MEKWQQSDHLKSDGPNAGLLCCLFDFQLSQQPPIGNCPWEELFFPPHVVRKNGFRFSPLADIITQGLNDIFLLRLKCEHWRHFWNGLDWLQGSSEFLIIR